MPSPTPAPSPPHSHRRSPKSTFSNHVVTSHYSACIASRPTLISITWCRSLMGQGFCVGFQCLSSSAASRVQQCKVDMKPWLFWKKQGSKRVNMVIGNEDDRNKTLTVEITWNLASAKYASGPEPRECYYLMITWQEEVVLLMGDMQREALKKKKKKMEMVDDKQMDAESAMVSRKEYVYGKQVYETKTRLSKGGKQHSISIECKEGGLSVQVDKQVVVDIMGSLMWKFRGNQSVLIDGLPVHVYWDVHDWLFRPQSGHAAVFMFQSSSSSSIPHHHQKPEPLQLPPSSSSFSPHSDHHGFSLLLFAVKNDKMVSS